MLLRSRYTYAVIICSYKYAVIIYAVTNMLLSYAVTNMLLLYAVTNMLLLYAVTNMLLLYADCSVREAITEITFHDFDIFYVHIPHTSILFIEIHIITSNFIISSKN